MTRARKTSVTPSLLLGASGSENVTRLLGATTLGLVELIRTGRISTAEACGLFFVPVLVNYYGQRRDIGEIMDAIHLGSELEDVSDIVPDALGRSLDEIREQVLRVMARVPREVEPLGKKWIRKPRRRR